MGKVSLDFRQYLHPCCRYSLQTGSRLIGYVNLALNLFSICIHGFLLLYFLVNDEELEITVAGQNYSYILLEPEIVDDWRIILIFSAYILAGAVLSVLAKYLLLAVESFDCVALSRWCLISLFLLIIRMLILIWEITGELTWAWSLLEMLYLVYSIWVVWSFQREIKLDRLIQNTILATTEKTLLRRPQFFTRL